VWINGRSDLVAGLWLALLLFVLSGRDVMVATGTRTLARTASLFAIGFLGSASKETFVPASLLAALSFAWPAADREAPAESRLRRAGCALWPTALGVGAYALARTLVLPNAPGVGPTQADNPLATSVGWLFLPKLAAIASHALLSLRAANMQSLSWDQLRALSLGEWLCGALGLFAAGGLLIKRDMRGVLQLAAACAGLAPVVLVMFVIWLGLDRYLYMPLMLILCAASPYAVRAHQALRRASPSLLPFAACAILALAAVNTFVASRAYQSQATWLSTLAAERPEDPSVVVFLATEVGAPRANEVLRGLPPPPWPSAVIAPVIALALAGGSPALAQRAAEYGTLHYPNNALILALTFRLRYLAGQQAQALALLPKLARRSSVCSEVRAQLGMWIERRQGREREQLAAARAALQCGQ
jgi:hypothetical protein